MTNTIDQRAAALGPRLVTDIATVRALGIGCLTLKDVVGYDLTSLFVGSEGTPEVITAATIEN